VDTSALQIGPGLNEEVDEVPAPRLQGPVDRAIPLEVEPISTPQQEGNERVLSGLDGDLQRRLRSCALGDDVRLELERLPFGDPALDVVQTPLATHLV
jgi:hypothetical protein